MKKRVLTVDDSATMRQMVGFTLRSAGYDVVEACDGVDALGKLGEPLSLIITDVNMPNMGGLDLLKAVRANARTRFVPVVVLTTESDPAKKQVARGAGATAWIVKPFRPEQLLAVVQKVLG